MMSGIVDVAVVI